MSALTMEDIDQLKTQRQREKARHYIEVVCDGMDLHTFDQHQDARSFGHAVRANNPEFDVEINYVTVRIRMKRDDRRVEYSDFE